MATVPRARARAPVALRQTEDALLDMHQECKLSRQAMRRQAEQLRSAHEAIGAERERATSIQQDLLSVKAQSEAIETVFALELRALEREIPTSVGEANLRRQLQRLRSVASEAVAGMEEARAECEWLHEQLRRAVQSDDGTNRVAATGAVCLGHTDGSAGGFPSSCAAPSAMALHLGGSQRIIGGGDNSPADGTALLVAHDDMALDAARADFARAIQRCHAVQVRRFTIPRRVHSRFMCFGMGLYGTRQTWALSRVTPRSSRSRCTWRGVPTGRRIGYKSSITHTNAWLI